MPILCLFNLLRGKAWFADVWR